MSHLIEDQISSEKFIENAMNDVRIENVPEQPFSESEKLILDEISNEKSPFDSVPISKPKLSPKKVEEFLFHEVPNKLDDKSETIHSEPKEEVPEKLSDDTESTRDLKNSERDLTDEEEEVKSEESKEFKEEDESKDEWQDILGSGVILKKILKSGEPDSRPIRSDSCFINYTCRLEEADEYEIAERGENFQLGLGEGDVVQGLDVAIGLMNKNERCLLKIGSRLAFGEKGLPPNIPGNSTVMYDVELIDVQHENDFDSLSVQDRRKMGNKKRERGNWWYLRGENTLAVQCYRRALDFLDEVETESTDYDNPTDADLQQLLEDRLKVLNNMASAQIKMELYDQALTSLQTVLRCQPDNVKALFRKAKIYSAKNDLNQALRLLEKAKALEPEDSLITKEINTVSGLINKQKNSEKEYARRMFGGTTPNASTSKTNVDEKSKKSSSKFHIMATLGATVVLALAAYAYKFKY